MYHIYKKFFSKDWAISAIVIFLVLSLGSSWLRNDAYPSGTLELGTQIGHDFGKRATKKKGNRLGRILYELPYKAALRELKEETSIVSVKPIKEIEEKLTYILPDHLIGIIWKGKYKGQKQKWFIMKFIGNDSEINIKTKHPEFLDWKWIDPENLTDIAVHFKLEVYKKLKSEIKKILD